MDGELFTLSHPRFSEASEVWLTDVYRPRYPGLTPHFTLLFGQSAIGLSAYSAHVRAVARSCASFDFECRKVAPAADLFGPEGHVFLVPDRGEAEVAALHGALYGGVMAPFLREDVAFTPHITLMTLRDLSLATECCDRIGSAPIRVQGSVDTVSIVLKQGDVVEILETIELRSKAA